MGCSNTNITPEITEQISVTPPQAVPTLTPTPITDMVETGVINQKDVMLGNNPTNFIYNGLIAKDNDWIYFPTYYLDEQVGFGRINAKGEDFSYVTSTETVYRDLNVSNKYLYYIEMSGTKFGGDIVRVDKDGSNKVVLLEGDFFGLTMINEYLYFIDNNEYRMYRMKSAGTDLTLFSIDNCDLFFYDNGYLYVSTFCGEVTNKNVKIVRYNIDNPNEKYVVAENLPEAREYGYLIHFFVHEGKVFYLDKNDHCIYSVNGDGSEPQKLNDIPVESMLLGEDDYIYCISRDKKRFVVEIVRFDITGGNVKITHKFYYYGSFYLLGTTGEYLYYIEGLGEGSVSGTTRIKIDGTGNEDLSEKYINE